MQCYFTDATPSTRNSGTSMVISRDGGKTWGEYHRVSRQYKYTQFFQTSEGYVGKKIYTDQMPSTRLLHDGQTIFGFFEARLEPDGPTGRSTYKMSFVYNNGFEWADLGENGTGPSDRKTNVIDGAG